MTLVLTILIGVVVLVGLITVIMSVKNWHWAQMLLLLAIFFSAIGTLILGLEVYRIHHTIRSKLPAKEQQLADLEEKNEALTKGGSADMARKVFGDVPFNLDAEGSMPSLSTWTTRLQDVERQRGRVWKGVTPAGIVEAATGRIAVAIPNPKPHGLEQNALVYLFEQGEPNAASPDEGAQYLGQFKVTQVNADGAVLESVLRLDNRTGNRLARSQKPWTIYETMPADSHELFAGVPEEQLRQWFPASTVEEYLRQGQPAEKPGPGPFNPEVAMYDEEGRRLGPDDEGKAVKWLYDRRLRDYDYLFGAANRELVELVAERTALAEDAKKLAAAHEIAKQLGALRTEEKQGLTSDLEHMKRDRAAIETQLTTVEGLLAKIKQETAAKQAENVKMAGQLKSLQQQRLDELDRQAPPPSALLLNAGR